MIQKLSYALKYLSPALLIIATTYLLIQVAITSLHEENQSKLSALAAILEKKIQSQATIYEHVRTQNIAELTKTLQPFLDEIVWDRGDLGASIFLPETEEIVAITPRQNINHNVSMHSPMQPVLRNVYETGQPDYYLVYSQYRNKNLYNYAYPLEYDGQVELIINVNQTAASIAKQINTIWISGASVCLIALLFWFVFSINRHLRDRRLQQEQAALVQWLTNSIGGASTSLDPNLTLLKDLPAVFAKAIDLVQYERKQHLRMINELPLGIMQFDADHKLRYINPAFAKMIGDTLEEVRQWDRDTWLKRYRTLDGQFVGDIFQRGETIDNLLGFVTHRNGEEIPFSLTVRILHNEEGRIVGYLLLLDDLSNEYALDRLNQKTHYIFNSVPLSVIILDDKQRITYINPAVSQLFGQSEQELLGQKLIDRLPWSLPDDPPTLPGLVQQVLETGMRAQMNNANRVIHNREYTLEFDLFPILNPYTSLTDGCMVLIKDKTLYREWEELSQRVDAHSNYVQMAATIAHEVRNPMTSVRGFLQLLAKQLDGPQHRTYLEVMQTEIDRMNAILSEYLSMARTPQPFYLEEINLSDLLRETNMLLEGEANYRGASIELCVIDDCLIHGMARELKQVLINLVRNAFEALENSGGVVKVELREEANSYCLTVTDNGCGISEEQIERIFEPFFTTKAMGTGLGLPVCKKIVESHGGALRVSSTVGEGTTFTIELPRI